MNDVSRISPAWHSWLPDSAIGWAGGDVVLNDVARAWSAKWLGRRSVRPSAALAATPILASEPDMVWTMADHDAAIGLSRTGRDRLALLMLGESRPPGDIAPSDRRILDRLVDDGMVDLCRRFGGALGMAPDIRWRALAGGEVPALDRPRLARLDADAATPLFHVALSTDLLIARARARAARAPRPRPLRPVAVALGAQPVQISAALGRCSLSLADLAGLGVGDVVLLDRKTDTPLMLALNGTPLKRGQCAVERAGDGLQLRLLDSLAG